MMWLPDGEKIQRYVYVYSFRQNTRKTDGQTDRQTRRWSRLCIASRSKNQVLTNRKLDHAPYCYILMPPPLHVCNGLTSPADTACRYVLWNFTRSLAGSTGLTLIRNYVVPAAPLFAVKIFAQLGLRNQFICSW